MRYKQEIATIARAATKLNNVCTNLLTISDMNKSDELILQNNTTDFLRKQIGCYNFTEFHARQNTVCSRMHAALSNIIYFLRATTVNIYIDNNSKHSINFYPLNPQVEQIQFNNTPLQFFAAFTEHERKQVLFRIAIETVKFEC